MSRNGSEHSIPPPLELLCLKALWSLGEASVRQVRQTVSVSRPLAYTTVMTVMERLARKGIVARRKNGRAFLYSPLVSRDTIRRLALAELLEGHFDGSPRTLIEFLQTEVTQGSTARLTTELDAALL